MLNESEVPGLLDTDLMVEIQRSNPSALQWLNEYEGTLSLPSVVAFELLLGSRNRSEMERNERFIQTFDVDSFGDADDMTTRLLILKYRLSTGLGLPDFMIAAQAINRKAILYTFNLKHFGTISELDARSPFNR